MGGEDAMTARVSRESPGTHHTYLLGLPSHTDLGWLARSIGRWGKTITRGGDPEVGRLAASLSDQIGRLRDLEETGGDKKTYDVVLKRIHNDYTELKSRLRPLDALRALARMLEDLDDMVLKPTGRRASEVRVSARYVNR
jgi:hypothetical protein